MNNPRRGWVGFKALADAKAKRDEKLKRADVPAPRPNAPSSQRDGSVEDQTNGVRVHEFPVATEGKPDPSEPGGPNFERANADHNKSDRTAQHAIAGATLSIDEIRKRATTLLQFNRDDPAYTRAQLRLDTYRSVIAEGREFSEHDLDVAVEILGQE